MIMDIFIVTLFIVISSFIYFCMSLRRTNGPPGPLPYPFVGNGPLIRKLSKQYNGFHSAVNELCKSYNTDILSLKLGREYTVVVQSEELINKVFANEEFQARPDNFFLRLRSMGKRLGITMTDGSLWSEQRTFAFRHLHELGFGKRRMDEMIQIQLQEMVSTLENCDVNSTILRRLLSKCVLNVLWEFVTGEMFNNKEETLNDLLLYMEKRDKAFDMMGGLLNQFPFLRFICPELTGYNAVQKLNAKFKDIMMKVINEHKQTYTRTETRDFIDAFLHEMNTNDGSASTFTEDQLVMVCLDFFIAGSRTISGTLDFLLLHMVLNPDIQEKVQSELDGALKPGSIPSAHDKLKCPYTEAVILESQRLSSVVPMIGPRRTLYDTTLADYFIPKGTILFMNVGALNKNSIKWENPDVMMPERFLDENRKLSRNELYSFGKGKRRCPGEALAKNFLFIFFSGILLNFKLQVCDKNNPPSLKFIHGITSSPAEYFFKSSKRFP